MKKFTFLIFSVVLFSLAVLTTASAVSIENPLYDDTIPELLKRIFTTIAGIVGAISTIMIIVAGIMYLTSAGSPEKMNAAKKTFIYAIVGIVIAVMAATIVAIIEEVLGVSPPG